MPYQRERETILEKVRGIWDKNEGDESLILDIFRFQAKYNEVYKSYLHHIRCDILSVQSLNQIPFLPIQLFKTHTIHSGAWKKESTFRSSGTTSMIRSEHHIRDTFSYHVNAQNCFEQIIGPVEQYCYLALLPGYLERQDSSLVSMVDYFIRKSEHAQSGFYLYNHEKLHTQLLYNIDHEIPTVFFGVSFALLDFAKSYSLPANKIIIMETGGMKSTSAELSKAEIYTQLRNTLGTKHIYSEYGMTELLSQAYAIEENVFHCPKSMQVRISELNDPFHFVPDGVHGQINIIDLANIDTMAFIQTEDLGRKLGPDTFEITGRLDISDLRGCNLLLES